MEIKEKENNGISIKCNLSKEQYLEFIKSLKELGKYHEFHSEGKQKYTLLVSGLKTPHMFVNGWNSRCYNKETGEVKEVLFMDMDGPVLYWLIKEELRFLMKKYNLPPFYVFVSSTEVKNPDGNLYGDYLIINLGKHTFKEIIDIHNDSHFCDSAFKSVGRHNLYRTWVTRLGHKGKKNKPYFKEIIGDLTVDYPQEVSKGHLQALKQLYEGIPEVRYTNLDKSKVEDVFVNTYLTASK